MALTADDKKAVVRLLYARWNDHDMEAVAQMIDEFGYVDHKNGTIPPRDDVGRKLFRTDRDYAAQVLANVTIAVEDLVADADSDRVAVRVAITAQQIGPYKGIQPAPDGRIEIRAISIMRIAGSTVEDAKLVEHWEESAVVCYPPPTSAQAGI